MTQSTPKTQPFTFERAFDREQKGERPRPAQRKMLSLDEIETLKRDAHAAGLRAGETGQIRRAADALGLIAQKIEALGGALEANLKPARADAAQLAYVTALKLARAALEKFPQDDIKALILRCIDEQKSEPHLVLRVNDTLHDDMRETVKRLGETRAFGGRIHVIGEPEIPVGDCQIEWADGGLERNLNTALAQIETVIRNYVVSADGAAGAPPTPATIMASHEAEAIPPGMPQQSNEGV